MNQIAPISQTATAAYTRVQALSDYNRDIPRDKSRTDLKDSGTRSSFGPATRVTLSAAAHSAVSADRAERAEKADKTPEKPEAKPEPKTEEKR
jgi:hypothetical protein